MRFTVLALDYDGTIARDGHLDPEVRAAIADVRARGITVVIVTGRILDELRRVAGDLRFVDAVVAENGAMLAFPESGRSVALSAPPPQSLIDEIRRRQVPIQIGHSVIETEAQFAPAMLTSIRAAEIPYVLIFNRGRLMALPSGVNKATGLREALRTLRLSPHNAIAIGDAENDYDLLDSCELGVAVAWGSDALKQKANEIVEGTGPEAVAPYIRQASEKWRLPSNRVGSRVLYAGTDKNDKGVFIPVRGRNLLIVGDPKSGKSWLTGLICEQLIEQRYSVCVIDPEGDYSGLTALPGVIRLGGESSGPTPRELRAVLRYPDVNVVIDLSHMEHGEKWSYIRSLLAGINQVRQRVGIPHRIVLDEAHYFLHDSDALASLDLELGGYTFVTYQPSQLHADLLAAVEVTFVTRLTDSRELDAMTLRCVDPAESRSVLTKLTLGHAVMLPGFDEWGVAPREIRLPPRLTPHVRHREKYIDVPIPDAHAFIFSRDGQGQARARTLREFANWIVTQPVESLDEYLRRADFSRWIAAVFGDTVLAEMIRRVEDQFREGRIGNVNDAIVAAIKDRYELDDTDAAASR